MKRIAGQRQPTARTLILLACAAGLVLLCAVAAWSQAAGSSASPEKQASSQQSSQAHEPEGPGAELTEASREAAGEAKGENDELKKSQAVSFVARLTGMSLEHAYWVCVLLNFAVIAGVIAWVFRARLPGVFRGRTQSIQKAMQEAQKASEEANRRLAEIEARLSRLGAEIAEMQAVAEKEAAAEEARIETAAAEDRRKIVEAAEQEIEAAAKAARRDLKVFAADLSVDLAQRAIRVDAPTDQALVRTFSEQLGKKTNGTGRDGH